MIREIAEENLGTDAVVTVGGQDPVRPAIPLRNPLFAYGLSLLGLGLMLGLRASLNPLLVGHVPYSLCYVAVVFAAWIGGLGPASAVILVGFVVAERFFVPQSNSLFFNGLENWLGLGSYLLVSCSVVLVIEGLRHEQKRRLAAVRETAEILDSVANAFVAIDKDWKLQYLNVAAEAMIGFSKEDLIGRDAREIASGFMGSVRHRAYTSVMETRVRITVEDYFASTGQWFEVHISPLADGGVAAYYMDITARKREDGKVRSKIQELEYKDRVETKRSKRGPRVSVEPECYTAPEEHPVPDEMWSPW